MNTKHLLTVAGILVFTLFVIAKNGLLLSPRLSHILSSEYLFYLSVLLIFIGYFLSTTKDKTTTHTSPDSTPGLGGKNSHIDNDFGGSD